MLNIFCNNGDVLFSFFFQLITTESGSPPKPTSVITTLTALDSTEEAMTDIMKTYYITYTYYNTFFEKGTSVIRTNVATSTNVVLEKIPTKDTSTTKVTQINATPEPIQIFATKTYLTTFTYFTTLLQVQLSSFHFLRVGKEEGRILT